MYATGKTGSQPLLLVKERGNANPKADMRMHAHEISGPQSAARLVVGPQNSLHAGGGEPGRLERLAVVLVWQKGLPLWPLWVVA
jgi:hypothetical protein